MGNYIVKPDLEEDFYVVWSSVADGPMYWGSRDILLLEMDQIDGPDPERFDRADVRGSSSYVGWGKGDFICKQMWLRRENLKKYCLRLEGVGEEFADQLLEPLENE
jgi:hypothetical protein